MGKAKELGVTGVEGIENPILIRRRKTEIEDISKFTQKANEADTAKFSATEQATMDAENLTLDDLMVFQPNEHGAINTAANQPFIKRFVSKMTSEEQSGYLTEEGRNSKQLIDRIQNAIFQKAYGSKRLSKLASEEADPDIKNILNGLNKSAGNFAKAQGFEADLTGVGISKDIISAIDLIILAKNSNNNIKSSKTKSRLENQVNQETSQRGMFGEYSTEQQDIAEYIAKNIRSSKRIGEFFDDMAVGLKTYLADLIQMELFGKKEDITSSKLIIWAKEKLEARYAEKQQDLLQGETEENALRYNQRSDQKGEQDQGRRTETNPLEEEINLFGEKTGQQEMFQDGTKKQKKPRKRRPRKQKIDKEQGDLFTGMPQKERQIDLFPTRFGKLEKTRDSKNKSKSTRQVETGVRDSGYIKSYGLKVKDTAEAASLFSHLVQDAQENAYTITVDKDNNVLEVHEYSRGSKSSSTLSPTEVAGRVLRVPGAAKVYFIHNHPSGSTDSSRSDKKSFKNLEKILKLKKITLADGIVIGKIGNTPSYGTFSIYGDLTPFKEVPAIESNTEIKTKRRYLKKDEPLAPFENAYQAEAYLKDKPSGFVLLDTKGKVAGFLEFTPGQKSKDLTAEVIKETEATNSLAVIMYNNDPVPIPCWSD